MAGGAGERGDDGGASSRTSRRRPQEPPVRLEDVSLNTYVLAQTYLLRAVTGLGYLALTWSTVVLLGGFVTALLNTDFWCITVISMIQAARIFDDLAEQRFGKFVWDAMEPMFRKMSAQVTNAATRDHHAPERRRRERSVVIVYCARAIFVLLGVTVVFPCSVAVWLLLMAAGLVHDLGPLACTGLSLWRLLKRDYLRPPSSGGDDAAAGGGNLVPALDIFYSLVLFQGAFYCVWSLCTSDRVKQWQVDSLNRRCELADKLWGKASTEAYFSDTKARCWKDPGSIDGGGGKLVHYAVDQLGAESWRENRSGARVLGAFAGQGADLRPLLLPSRPKVQKLIDTLGWRRGPPETRELAARVVADVAGDIHLAQFPGAIRCISSLLQHETTTAQPQPPAPVRRRGGGAGTNRPRRSKEPSRSIIGYMRVLEKWLTRLGQQVGKVAEQKEPPGHGSDGHDDGGCSAEMILQGLTILERLASNHHNCSDICSAPGLLPRITAPLYSGTLIQDLDAVSGSTSWPGLVGGSFRVLHCLMCAPTRSGRRLRHEIARNSQAMANLEMILQQGDGASSQELQIQANKILTELALDSSVNLGRKTKENLIKQQLRTFLYADEGGEEAASLPNPIKVTAGRMLVLISTNSQANSNFIMRLLPDDNNTAARTTKVISEDKKNTAAHVTEIAEDDKTTVTVCQLAAEVTADDNSDSHPTELTRDKKNTVAHLAELLDAKNNIAYRTIAAEILDNLCTHCDWNENKQIVTMESLLLKVLTEILSIKSGQPESKISEEKENKPKDGMWTLFKRKNNRGNQRNSAPAMDEENQEQFAPRTVGPGQRICTLGDRNIVQDISSSDDQKKSSDQQNEEETATKKLQEALLSLALVILGKLVSPGDVVEEKAQAFVVKLKTIIHDNCQPTADSLRIVKLCGQIAESMMPSQSYAKHFRDKGFLQSLSKASKIMSSLESCMLFAGTDFGLKQTVRPLLSEVEKKVSELEKKALQ